MPRAAPSSPPLGSDPRLVLPGFIIIGAMKSATSSLYHWLGQQPECHLATPKETNFFSFEEDWQRGVGWYSGLFAGHADRPLRGEASVSYTYPTHAPVAAERMASVVPGARLIFVIRQPIERLRSHYRHELQRNRERMELVDALTAPGNPYVDRSCYHKALEPYIRRFPRQQICVVRFDDLVHGDRPGWATVLDFLGLPYRPAPADSHNVTRDNGQWTSAMRWLQQRRMLRPGVVSKLPGPIRKLGRRALIQDGDPFERTLSRSLVPIPDRIVSPIWEDLEMLEGWLGVGSPLWPRTSSPVDRS